MRVVVDDKIPYIREALSAMGVDAVYAPGSHINNALVRDADALIIRTRTRCDAALLQGSRVQFIATATIGYDHIDTAYCAAQGIRWTNAPGCNAASVRQYVQSVLLLLQKAIQEHYRCGRCRSRGYTCGRYGSYVGDARTLM